MLIRKCPQNLRQLSASNNKETEGIQEGIVAGMKVSIQPDVGVGVGTMMMMIDVFVIEEVVVLGKVNEIGEAMAVGEVIETGEMMTEEMAEALVDGMEMKKGPQGMARVIGTAKGANIINGRDERTAATLIDCKRCKVLIARGIKFDRKR